MTRPKEFSEICENCGCSLGAHLGTSYQSDYYKRFFLVDTCPGHEGRMDWDKSPGTVFKGSGKYKEEEEESKS